jgi:hypothetical protein
MRIPLLTLAAVVLCLGINVAAADLPDAASTRRSAQLTEPVDDATRSTPQSAFALEQDPSRDSMRRIARLVPVPPLFVIDSPNEPRHRKVMDRNFLLLAGLTFGLTAADVELTQHCLKEKTCVELNPTLPHSRWGMYAANTPVNLAVMYFSYRRKASGKGGWWIAPLVDAGIHGVGIGTNIRFAW